MKIIFAGTIGSSGLGGQAWASLQYLLGFRALGHEVFYLEDCGDTTWHWEKKELIYDVDYPAAYVRACLTPFGFGERWIYRAHSQHRGMPIEQFQEICSSADLLMMRAVPIWTWRKEYDKPRRRVFIDVDPGFTQILLTQGDKGWVEGVARAERRFSIGQRIGAPDCRIPPVAGPWLKTVPPVFLPEWPMIESPATHFTSIMRWQGYKEVSYEGVAYGQRDKEFPRFIGLPNHTAQKFRLALMGIEPETFTRHGWEIVPGEIISKTPESYREFIQQSRGEFTVPKHGYVAMRSGWFSDRSVCYLASGRPVVTEDTGLSDWSQVGEGLLMVHDLESAPFAIAAINSDYERHHRAARRLAEEYFATDRVLPELLKAAMN
jgi:hypothetical protein